MVEVHNMKINEIELFISNFGETVYFYENVLQFKCIAMFESTAKFQIGESILTFHKEEKHKYNYHFAFNIPPNLFQQAKEWVQAKIHLATEDGEDEAHFVESKARSFYFEDPAGNIVEYIARERTTPKSSATTFSAEEVVGISEIGLSTNNIEKYANELLAIGIAQREDEPLLYSQYLNFMGDYEKGVFILLGPVGRRWIFSDILAKEAPIIISTDLGVIKKS